MELIRLFQVMRPFPVVMDTWNPMAEDFRHPAFNSYSRGPAAGLGGNEQMRPGQKPKVHVSGVPLEMTGEGLTELFSQVANVVNAYVMPPKGEKHFKIGFVSLATLGDMEKAISKMNGHRIKNYTLRVSPAREKTESHTDSGRDRMFSRSAASGDFSGVNGGTGGIPSRSNHVDMTRDTVRSQGADRRGSDMTPPRHSTLSPMSNMVTAGCEECQQLLTALITHLQQHQPQSGGQEGNSPSPTKATTPDRVGHSMVTGNTPSPSKPATPDKASRNLINGRRDSSGGANGEAPRSDQRQEREPSSPSPRQSPGRLTNRNQSQQVFQQSSRGSAFSKPIPVPKQQDERPTSATSQGTERSPGKLEPKKDAPDIKPCEACGKAGSKHCSQCHVTYCSVQCQKGDWKRHKNKCKPNQQRSDPNDAEVVAASSTSSQLWVKQLIHPTPPQKEIRVIITHIVHPGSFWMQLAETSYIQEYARVVELINAQVNESAPLQSAQEGMLCLAQYSEDGGWYRAKILTLSGKGKITVSLVDFGNTDEVALENLRPATPEMMQIPLVVVHGSIAGVEPRGSSGKWSPDSSRLLEEIAQKSVRAKFVGQKAGMYQVELKCEEDGELVADMLIKKELAWPKDVPRKVTLMSSVKQTELPATDRPVRIMINHFVGPQEFYFHLVTEESERAAAELAKSLEKSLSSSQEKSGFTPQIGELCAGKFTDDDAWYRVHVESKHASGGYNVEYIDFGNKETVPSSRLRPLPDNFHNIPRKSFRASFADLKEGDVSSDDVQTTMKLLSQCMHTDNTFMAAVRDHDGPKVLLKIANPKTGKDVAEEAGLTSKVAVTHQAQDVPFQEVPLNQELNFVVSAVNIPAEFFALWQNPENEKRMLEIGAGVKEIGSQPEVSTLNPEVGHLYCAQFTGDKEWYRAAVLKKYPNREYDVQYIDYGNGERVPLSLMRPITDELAAIPRLCVACSLAGLPSYTGPWSSEVIQGMKDIVGEGTKSVIARVREHRNHVAYVELEDTATGLNITQEIVHLITETDTVASGPSSLSSNPALVRPAPAQSQTQAQAQLQAHDQSPSQPHSAPPAFNQDALKALQEQMAMIQAKLNQFQSMST